MTFTPADSSDATFTATSGYDSEKWSIADPRLGAGVGFLRKIARILPNQMRSVLSPGDAPRCCTYHRAAASGSGTPRCTWSKMRVSVIEVSLLQVFPQMV